MAEQHTDRLRVSIAEFSNFIFGLAISIGAVTIGSVSASPENFVSRIVAFAFNFLILMFVWFRYHQSMKALGRETGRLMVLSAVVLFFVALEPFMFNQLPFAPSTSTAAQLLIGYYASIGFALDMAALMFLLAILSNMVVHRSEIQPDEKRFFRLLRDGLLISCALFAISLLPQFWTFTVYGTPFRIYFWLVPALVGLLFHAR